MPQQETFFEQQIDNRRIEVLKTYDRVFALDAFEQMDEDALRFLHEALELPAEDGLTEKVEPRSQEFLELLWDEIEDGGREDWNTFSYFVVVQKTDAGSSPVYVSPDWPSAEAYAKHLVTIIQAT